MHYCSWQDAEREIASAHRGRHIGGPGRPDYMRGKVQGEVKFYSRPIVKRALMEECRKRPIKEIVCTGGFTKSARQYAERYRPCLRLLLQ